MFSLICAWIDAWVNNRGAGDLRHHRVHHDAIVMSYLWHTKAETKLPPFRRRYFQMNFLEWKGMNLTHCGRVTHICVSKLATIGSDNGLSPGRCQAIIWTNAGIMLIGPLGTNFSEILIEICTFSFQKMHLKMLYGKWRPCCLGLNVLKYHWCLFLRFKLTIFRHWFR